MTGQHAHNAPAGCCAPAPSPCQRAWQLASGCPRAAAAHHERGRRHTAGPPAAQHARGLSRRWQCMDSRLRPAQPLTRFATRLKPHAEAVTTNQPEPHHNRAHAPPPGVPTGDDDTASAAAAALLAAAAAAPPALLPPPTPQQQQPSSSRRLVSSASREALSRASLAADTRSSASCRCGCGFDVCSLEAGHVSCSEHSVKLVQLQ
jgi:hypothetical protein